MRKTGSLLAAGLSIISERCVYGSAGSVRTGGCLLTLRRYEGA